MPPVRQLQDLIAEQQASVAPQQGLIDQSIASNDASGTAQAAGLDATKTNSFNAIEQGAQNKGMAFSGFTPDEEAKYTAGTYLPALAQLQQTIAQTRSSLLGKKADLNTSVFDKASAMREGDVNAQRTWQQKQADNAFAAAEAEKSRQAAAQNAAADRASAQSIAAANRSASATKDPTPAQNMAAALSAKTGTDGFVHQGTYAALKSQWVSGGYGNAATFDQTFAGFRNPKNNQYILG